MFFWLVSTKSLKVYLPVYLLFANICFVYSILTTHVNFWRKACYFFRFGCILFCEIPVKYLLYIHCILKWFSYLALAGKITNLKQDCTDLRIRLFGVFLHICQLLMTLHIVLTHISWFVCFPDVLPFKRMAVHSSRAGHGTVGL